MRFVSNWSPPHAVEFDVPAPRHLQLTMLKAARAAGFNVLPSSTNRTLSLAALWGQVCERSPFITFSIGL